MDLTDVKKMAESSEPIEMPVSELLTGNYQFSIPSYQRGYRWESTEAGGEDEQEAKQVDDLLNDLTYFVTSNPHKKANYYLQPLMVKPRLLADGSYEWDVLDGQQRLTTMLLVLKCLKERLYGGQQFGLYELKYANRKQLDFNRITFDRASADYDFPMANENLDSYYVRKAKDRIERWYDNELSNNPSLSDKFKEMLFYPDETRGVNSSPALRAKFIWYNVQALQPGAPQLNGNRQHDIEVFNRLNRGKISLTDSELIKALFLLCIKVAPAYGSSLLTPETLVRKWDDMGKKFQNEEFWNMIAPKGADYSNRLDLLFDFIKDCSGNGKGSAYRFYYKKMHGLFTSPDINKVEELWTEVKQYFDTLCKWHENVHKHNFIGYLIENGEDLANIYSSPDLETKIRKGLGLENVDEIDTLRYYDNEGYKKIRKVLLLFNVLTCDKFGQKFPFNLYRDNTFDVEHVNSQTDNPIEKIDEKIAWVKQQAIPCLWIDRNETDTNGILTSGAREARDLITEGVQFLRDVKLNNNRDTGSKFKGYRTAVEYYYASGNRNTGMFEKDAIGNLALLNSSINREYKNALFPQKLRTLKRSDQEGVYIPLCTKYMFLKYYSNPQANVSAFSMMRWRQEDQDEYTEAIKESIRKIF
ncbi:MAG: DUF262 domain-containing protein [Prevotella sp.]|nr:DUF262 domain-containing protein [Prevotella sp.]